MGMRSLLPLLFGVLLSVGCQKVDPSVFMLGSLPENKIDTPANPANGRVTLGSNEHVLASGNYKLKGRVTTMASVGGAAGNYKLRGTVRF